ncbi:MAG: hypothetical protein ACI8W8_000668 [Rhodothermales bacterium]|jgi:hypothetical protein
MTARFLLLPFLLLLTSCRTPTIAVNNDDVALMQAAGVSLRTAPDRKLEPERVEATMRYFETTRIPYFGIANADFSTLRKKLEATILASGADAPATSVIVRDCWERREIRADIALRDVTLHELLDVVANTFGLSWHVGVSVVFECP